MSYCHRKFTSKPLFPLYRLVWGMKTMLNSGNGTYVCIQLVRNSSQFCRNPEQLGGIFLKLLTVNLESENFSKRKKLQKMEKSKSLFTQLSHKESDAEVYSCKAPRPRK